MPNTQQLFRIDFFMNSLDAIDRLYLDVALTMASSSDIYLKRNPMDATLFIKEKKLTEKIVSRSDSIDMDYEVIDRLKYIDADTVYRLMPPTDKCVAAIKNSYVKRCVIGRSVNFPEVDRSTFFVSGLIEKEVGDLNRGYFKKMVTGIPYLTCFQCIGLDGVPIENFDEPDVDIEFNAVAQMIVQSGAIVSNKGSSLEKRFIDPHRKVDGSLQIFGNEIAHIQFKDSQQIESEEKIVSGLRNVDVNQLVWIVSNKDLSYLKRYSLIDDLVTHFYPAVGGDAANSLEVIDGRFDPVGDVWKMYGSFKSIESC